MSLRASVAIACVILTAAVSFGVRSLTWDDAIRSDRVYFYGTDGWYHMRRIVHAVDNELRLTDFPKPDPYLNYPDGGESYWGPLFDLSIAAGLVIFGVEERPEQEVIAAVIPACLGALCSVGMFLAGWSTFGWGTGLVAAALLAILPGHITYSQLGHLDHHVLESLLFVLLLASFMGLLSAPSRTLVVVGSALTLCLFLTTPITSIVHVMVLTAYAIVEIRSRGVSARYLSVSLALAAILLLPLCLYWIATPTTGLRTWGGLPPWLLFERLSLLQPLVLLLAAVATSIAERISVRLASAGTALAAILLWPLLAGLGVLLRQSPDVAYTSEMQSILHVPGQAGSSVGPGIELFGLFFPFVGLIAGYRVWREPEHRGIWAATLVGFSLVLIQVRFVYTFSFFMVLLLARMPTILPRHRWLGAVALAISLFPCINWIDALAHQKHYRSITPAMYDALRWLREVSPSGTNYSVLASWDLGHAIVYLAERPVVADPFNHGFEAMARYFTSVEPDEAQAILEEKRVGYVIPTNLGHPYLRDMFLAYARRPAGFPVSREVLGRGPLELERLYESPDGSVLILEGAGLYGERAPAEAGRR
ncbi:MAG TPA: STT3 domain-containing protein [Vicinamibacteria bacterium]|nr:STT3 domain-containing protein [Vicinamibacteria bacterium]